MSKYEYLVTFDADRIHDYVFATGRLKEIIGGSYIVDRFTEGDLNKILCKFSNSSKLIYAAGGAGKVLFEKEEDAIEFKNTIKTEYRRCTVTSSLSAAHVKIGDDFEEAAQEGERLLRQDKDDKREEWQLTNNPLIEFCNSCGQFPVAGQKDGYNLCYSCINKRRAKEELKRYLLPSWKGGQTTVTDFWGAFLQELDSAKRSECWKGFQVIDDMDDFRRISHPEGYVGFIYTDGNNMGLTFGKLEQSEEYSVFSDALKEGTKRAMARALAKHLDTPVEGYAPFYPVLVGGDDVIVMVAAHETLDVAVDFCKRFNDCVLDEIMNSKSLGETEKKELIEKVKDASSSAGVVLAHSKHPIISMLNRAEELLRSAKRRSDPLESAAALSGAIDFLMVTSPTLRSLSDIRSDEYTFDPGEKVICTARPYLTGDLERLISWARRFKREGFPKTKLNAFYSAMFQPSLQAHFDALLIRSRLADQERDLFNCFFADFAGINQFPYEPTGLGGTNAPKKKSVLTDLVEIYDFTRTE